MFNQFPTITVPSLTDPTKTIKTIDFNYQLSVNSKLFEFYELYDTYTVNEYGERPDQISFNYYRDQKYYWLVLLANNITNYTNQWALSYYELESYIENKYKYPNQIKHCKTKSIKINNIEYLTSGLIVDKDFNLKINNEIFSGKDVYDTVTYRQYEIEENDKKRNIKLLKPSIVKTIEQSTVLITI